MKLSDYLKNRYSKSTAKAYQRQIEIYQSHQSKAEGALYKDIVHYIGQLRNRYSNPRTVNMILSSIKVYYDFLTHSGKRKDHPAKSIRLRDKQNRDVQLQDLFTREELESLLTRKERYTALAYRNQVMVSLLIYQGLQVEEITALTLQDINLSKATLYIKATRTTNSRVLSLKSTQVLLFHEYQTEIRPMLLKGKETDIFMIGQRGTSFKKEDLSKHVLRSYKQLYVPRKVTATTIRQSVITNLLKAGNDLRIVQVFAGHKYPSTTEKYKQTSLEELKTGIECYHPLR
jgi:integrase/recombinase XerD